MSRNGKSSSYGQILKSSALIGGSSLISVLLSMIRVKFSSIYLGPMGVGLFSTYSTILSPISTITGLGIPFSGVQGIARALGEEDKAKAARLVLAVKRASIISAVLSVFLTVLFSYPIATLTFGDSKQAIPLCVLSLTLFVGSLTAGQSVILQGFRRIRELAMQTSIAAIVGLPPSIALMIFFGVDSIIPIMLLMGVISLIATWWNSRKVEVACVQMTWMETLVEIRPMLKLGFVSMSNGLLTAAVTYLVRLMIIRKLGIEACGLYSSAWMLSSYYVGFILGAMWADFYPRLSGVSSSSEDVNRIVNEQTEVGLLMALPGVLGTLTLATVVIHVFYTAKFAPAISILQWQILGVLLRVICWPVASIIPVMGANRLYLYTEIFSSFVILLFTWFGIQYFGLTGTGIAFFGLYIVYLAVVLGLSQKLSGFRLTHANIRLITAAFLLAFVSIVISNVFSNPWSISYGIFVSCASGLYGVRQLIILTGKNPFLPVWRRVTGRS